MEKDSKGNYSESILSQSFNLPGGCVYCGLPCVVVLCLLFPLLENAGLYATHSCQILQDCELIQTEKQIQALKHISCNIATV